MLPGRRVFFCSIYADLAKYLLGSYSLFSMKYLVGSALVLSLLGGCSGLEESEKEKIRQMNAIGEYIYRSHDEEHFALKTPKKHIRENYPWEEVYIGEHVRITKEFFRCKGNSKNAPLMKTINNAPSYTFDCGGMQQHSLPLKDGKEFIYPALIDLLNYIQEKTKKKVVISCGHRCPTHNTYADNTKFNRTSKHMIGAEVDFYVKGMEWSPGDVVLLLAKYYQEHPRFMGRRKFTEFLRYEKHTNVSTLPWYNKEIFIKLFKKGEGRDLDNKHSFPYICIQLKWDRDLEEPVRYSWAQAFNGYLRY